MEDNRNPLTKEEYLRRKVQVDYGVRGDYFRDQTAIIHSMPFRRLKKKTQVFFAPENDHVCTRIEHVLHVATIAATICKGLNQYGWELDSDLAYAIGLGHDLGHAPFGHAGEKILNDLYTYGPFYHEINSYRTVEHLANNGKGLNLTYAVKDGIICHNGENFEQAIRPDRTKKNLEMIDTKEYRPSSYEGCIVRMSDKIAYLGRDIEDAILANFIKISDIPQEIRENLGQTNGNIIDALVEDVISASKDKDEICFSDDKYALLLKLKEFNYNKIYLHPEIAAYEKMGKNILTQLFHHFLELLQQDGYEEDEYQKLKSSVDETFITYVKKMDYYNQVQYSCEEHKYQQIVIDYIAGMTDEYALKSMKNITIPIPIRFVQ